MTLWLHFSKAIVSEDSHTYLTTGNHWIEKKNQLISIILLARTSFPNTYFSPVYVNQPLIFDNSRIWFFFNMLTCFFVQKSVSVSFYECPRTSSTQMLEYISIKSEENEKKNKQVISLRRKNWGLLMKFFSCLHLKIKKKEALLRRGGECIIALVPTMREQVMGFPSIKCVTSQNEVWSYLSISRRWTTQPWQSWGPNS